jgi:hypothetical protein
MRRYVSAIDPDFLVSELTMDDEQIESLVKAAGGRPLTLSIPWFSNGTFIVREGDRVRRMDHDPAEGRFELGGFMNDLRYEDGRVIAGNGKLPPNLVAMPLSLVKGGQVSDADFEAHITNLIERFDQPNLDFWMRVYHKPGHAEQVRLLTST